MQSKQAVRLSAFLVLAGVLLIALQARPAHASHFGASAVTCTPMDMSPNVYCSLTIGPLTTPLPLGDVITVTLTGGTFVRPPARVGGTCASGPVLPSGAGAFQLTLTTACDIDGTIVIEEVVTRPETGTVCQTITDTDVSSTEPALVCSGVLPLAPPVASKSCVTPAVPGRDTGTAVVGRPFTCDITITFPFPPLVSQPGSVVVTNGILDTPTGGSFTCPAGGATCTISETTRSTTAGLVPAQTLTIAGATLTPALRGIVEVIAPPELSVVIPLSPPASPPAQPVQPPPPEARLLMTGCNNVPALADESVAEVALRVRPTEVVFSI